MDSQSSRLFAAAQKHIPGGVNSPVRAFRNVDSAPFFVVRAKGASALPMDPFAFLHDWLRHYEGQCVGKQGLDLLTKGLQGVILSRGYITTRVLLPAQDLSKGTLRFAVS